jgi:hypothetical protein
LVPRWRRRRRWRLMVNEVERFINFLNSKGYRLPDGYRALVIPIGDKMFKVELVTKDG